MTRSPLERRPMPQRSAPDHPLSGSTHRAVPGLTWPAGRREGKAGIVTTRDASYCTAVNSTSSCSRGSGSAGLTVTELLVVLFFGLVMIALGARFMGDWYDQYRFSGLVRSLTNAVGVARARAIGTQSFGRLDLAQGSESFGAADSALQDGGLLTNPRFYRLNFLWSPKLTTDSKPFYEVEVRPSYDPSTAISEIWFNAQGFAVAPPLQVEDPPGSGTWAYRQNGYASYQVTVKGNAVNREASFTITPLGKVRQGDST